MPTDQVEEVKRKIDIVGLISSFVPLKKAGKNFKGVCPFHTEKTPSFMVSPELQIFKCFGCGESGDIFTFIQKMEGLEFYDALKLLGERAGVKIQARSPSQEGGRKKRLFEINDLASRYFNYLLTEHSVGKKALDYLYNRGLKKETVKEFNLGYAPNSWSSLGDFLVKKGYTLEDLVASGLASKKTQGQGFYDSFRGRVMFPLRDVQGRTIGFTGRQLEKSDKSPKYINTPETLIFKKGNFLYGLDLAKGSIRKEGLAVIAEGQTDCISSHQSGTKNVVASSGTALTPHQIKLLSRYTNSIAICFDTDSAGDTAARRGFELAEKGGLDVFALLLPDKYQDLDECIRADPAEWVKIIAEPVPVYDFYFKSILKKYNPATPLGKKKVGDFLTPIIKSILNDFQRSAYISRLASLLSVHESVVLEALSKLDARQDSPVKAEAVSTPVPQSLEEYTLTLLFHAPFDAAKTAAYKLGQGDFSNPELSEIFSGFKKGLRQRTRSFAIKTFRGKLNNVHAQVLDRLYLHDLGGLVDQPEELVDELESAVRALKKRAVKRELSGLSSKIKQAEINKDTDLLKDLQEKFSKVSEKL